MGKVAGQRVTFGASARITAIAASVAAAAALLLPSTALAAMEIGSAQGDPSIICDPSVAGFDSVQIASSADSYVVPTGGTLITSWTVAALADTGPVGLEVWRPTADPLTFTLVGSTKPTTLKANFTNTFTVTPAIGVQAGDLIGLRVDGFVECQLTSAAGVIGFKYGPAPTGGDVTLDGVFGGFQLNIAASVDVTINPPPPPPTPTTADQCKHGGWQGLTDTNGTLFKNQGDCVSFVATHGTNLAG